MSDETQDAARPDPKELMKEALDRKQAQHHRTAEAANNKRTSGGPHGQVGGKRTFRRKAGG
jgi:hypothetical protein